MTANELLRRYPNASASFFRANLSAEVGVSDSKQCERKKTLEGNLQRETQSARPLHCCFRMRRKSLLDIDAKYASVKDLLDCLVFSKVIPGDKEGQITLEVQQQKCGKDEPEEIVIEVWKV